MNKDNEQFELSAPDEVTSKEKKYGQVTPITEILENGSSELRANLSEYESGFKIRIKGICCLSYYDNI